METDMVAPAIADEFALGNILVAHGHITRPQLESALRQQLKTGRRLGEELIKAGHANKGQVESGLLLQRKLIAFALAATVGLAPLGITAAEAAQVSSAIGVSVTVVAHATLKSDFQMTQLKISKNDIALGYVEISAASRFTVVSNSRAGYLLEFNPVGDIFDAVQIDGLGNTVQIGAEGGVIVQRKSRQFNPMHELSFRFLLRPDILPGNYPWPLQLSVRSL